MNKPEVHIPKQLIPQKEKTIFLAISGGVDSVVLLDLLSNLSTKIHLLHVNYHLRGEESEQDEQLVRQLAKRYSCELTVLDFDMNAHLKEQGGNLQDEARKIRYNFFADYVKSHSILMTAHHFDDQMETFFMHLSRKSGIAGMSCMAEKNDQHWRPLLAFRKAELSAYAKEHQLAFREDKSNQENKYLRNRWRNEWIPMMEKSIPALAESVAQLISVFQEERKRLESEIAPALINIQITHRWPFASFETTSTKGKYLMAKELSLRPTELLRMEELKLSGKSKRIEIDRLELTIWNDEDAFLFDYKQESKLPVLQTKVLSKLPNTFDKNCLILDPDKLHGNLSVREWKNGDRIASIGMKGTQLVSDIIKDAKVSAAEKANVWVVEDEKNILWVVGYKISRRAIATHDSTSIRKVTLSLA